MQQEKKGNPQPSEGLSRREGAKRPRYTELRKGDVLVGATRVYLVVRREGEGVTYLALLGEEGRPIVVVRSLQDTPLDPCWELVGADNA